KKRYVPHPILSTMIGVIITTTKLNSQLLMVDTALAFCLVLVGLISAGYSHGSGSQVAPKNAIYRNNPAAAPLAAVGDPGIRQANVMSMLVIWPTVPHRKSCLRPAFSMMNHDVVAKMEYTIMFTPPIMSDIWRDWPIESSKRIGK